MTPGPVGQDLDTEEGAAVAEPPLIVATIAREQGITGVHTHVRELRRYLQERGDSAELVTPHTWGEDRQPWGGVVLLPLFGARVLLERLHGPSNVRWYRSSHRFFLTQALRRRLSDGWPCTVYAQCPVAAQAALAARTGPHQRVVLAVHFRISQADEWADKGQIARDGRTFRWIRNTERRVIPRVDGLVFVSAWGRAALQEWLPEVDHVRDLLAPNFVEGTNLASRSAARGDLVTVGNLEAIKNHRYLLRVLAAARRAGHVYSLDIFGEGAERERLLALAGELDLGDRVRLHGFKTDVRERLSGYRAYVHSSYSESLPLAVIEAMGAGLPVVASQAGGVGELFDDPEQGRFWPLDDVEKGARILIDLMECAGALERVGRAARARFLHDYDADVVAPRLLRFLREPSSAD